MVIPGTLESDLQTKLSTWLDRKDIFLMTGFFLLKDEDDFLAMLFLFHRGVTRTLAGFDDDEDVGDDGVLPPLVGGEDDDEGEEDGSGGRDHSDSMAAPCPPAPWPSSWA